MIKLAIKAFVLLLAVANFHPLFAESQGRIEIRAAGFIPSSERFRDIYHNIGASYQIEASANICGCVDAWVNFDWFSKHGRSSGFGDQTRISIANASLGLKVPFRACGPFTPYVGIGPAFALVRLKNKSSCCSDRVSKHSVGAVFKTGVYYCINGCAFLDIFVDYLYQPVNFSNRVDVGGFKSGIGIGFGF